MDAVVFQSAGELPVVNQVDPVAQDGDLILDVVGAGVCGTDVRIYKGEHRAATPGRVPGHEIVGRVAGGTIPLGLSKGDLVFVAPNIGCGKCRWCGRGQENLCTDTAALGITIDGGFAQQVRIPAVAVTRGNVIPLPSLSDDQAIHYVLAEPLACVIRGQDKVTVSAGDTVLVYGGGPVGLLHIALASAQGAARVICSEPSAFRREAALRAGATDVVDPSAESTLDVLNDLTHGEGANVVITAAPVHALQSQALEAASTMGRVLYFGGLPKSKPTVELDTNLVHYKELLVTGTTASTVDDCRRAVELINAGVVDTSWMVSDILPINQFATAIAKAQDPQALKVAVAPKSKEH